MTNKLFDEFASDHYISIDFRSSKINFTVSLFTSFDKVSFEIIIN